MRKVETEIKQVDWGKAVDKWCSTEETNSVMTRNLNIEAHEMRYCLIKKRFPYGLGSGARHSSNPNPFEIVYDIIADSIFYLRNKHRFEFILACYQSRNYGFEFYWQSFKAPPEVNEDRIKRNRIKVCKRMVTLTKNKIALFEEEQNKSLFPMWSHPAYLRFKEKLEKYQTELDALSSENNVENKVSTDK